MSEPRIARTAKGKRPVYFADPATDKLMSVLLAVIGELSVSRERIDSLERLLDEKGILPREEVDNYVPDECAMAERAAARTAYIERVMRIVTAELQRPDESGATEDFARTLSSMLASDESD